MERAWATTTSPRGRALRTSLIAASLASAPELQKNTHVAEGASQSRSASRTFDVVNRFETCISRPTCSCTAATTFGWQWPTLLTEIPLRKSRYWYPSESISWSRNR